MYVKGNLEPMDADAHARDKSSSSSDSSDDEYVQEIFHKFDQKQKKGSPKRTPKKSPAGKRTPTKSPAGKRASASTTPKGGARAPATSPKPAPKPEDEPEVKEAAPPKPEDEPEVKETVPAQPEDEPEVKEAAPAQPPKTTSSETDESKKSGSPSEHPAEQESPSKQLKLVIIPKDQRKPPTPSKSPKRRVILSNEQKKKQSTPSKEPPEEEEESYSSSSEDDRDPFSLTVVERDQISAKRRRKFARQARSKKPLFDFKPRQITQVKPPKCEPVDHTMPKPTQTPKDYVPKYIDPNLSQDMKRLIESGFKKPSPRKPPQSPKPLQNKESYDLACERNERIIEGVIGDKAELTDRSFTRVMLRFEMSDKEMLDRIRAETGSSAAALKRLLANSVNSKSPTKLEADLKPSLVGAIANMKSTFLSPKKRPREDSQ